MTKWISTLDRLPELGVKALVTDGQRMAVCKSWIHPDTKKYAWECTCSSSLCQEDLDEITHWMPLPELPVRIFLDQKENTNDQK